MKIVYLEWVDVCSYSGWLDDSSEVDLEYIKTVGIVADENDDRIIITSSIATGSQNGDYIGAVVIPKGWIKKRRDITV